MYLWIEAASYSHSIKIFRLTKDEVLSRLNDCGEEEIRTVMPSNGKLELDAGEIVILRDTPLVVPVPPSNTWSLQ
jgi:predicted metalloprotease